MGRLRAVHVRGQGHIIFMDKCLGEWPVRKTQSRPKASIKVPFRKVVTEDYPGRS